MRFRFDANQSYQKLAVSAVTSLFDQTLLRVNEMALLKIGVYEGEFVHTTFDLDHGRFLKNIRAVQHTHGLLPDSELHLLREKVPTPGGEQEVAFPNLSVEMETGTGKTYVYLRTALELNQRFGLKKFIIVVPSVAIREGVLKTFKVTEGHFAELFDNVPYRYAVYESKNLNRLRGFAEDESVQFLIMTIDSFNREENVIRQRTDRLQGRVGLHLLQAARPVLILDEPQNMESAARKQALATLNPLCALRYSATHRNPYNLVYRLTPYDAYRQGLVKKIEVASVVKEDDFNQVFVRVHEIRAAKKTVSAKIAVHQRMADGRPKEKAYLFKPGDSLKDKAERSEYESFVISEINPGTGTVEFANGIRLKEGQAQRADEESVFREQVRYTVEQHFRRQEQLREKGLKVLSLFFIDRVENYTGDEPLIRRLFDEAFDDLKKNYPAYTKRKPEEVRGAYFAQKRRKGGQVELQNSTTGDNVEDRAAYALIMREKERLLSFDEPVSFIFSHSALKEGWDNPNVFQICTLNQTASETKKRQEIGRGMRLAVNQSGDRTYESKVNVLTVVANESYEEYVRQLQTEIEEEFGADEARKMPKPDNARRKEQSRRVLDRELPEPFKQLWERIKWRTRYRVQVDSSGLTRDCVADLDSRAIAPPRVVVTKATVRVSDRREAFEALQMSGAKTVATLAGRFPLPNLVAKIGELLEHTNPPLRLTRRTILNIVRGARQQQAVLDNPEEFATQAAEVIRDRLEKHLINGITYERDGTWYEMELFPDELIASAEKMVESAKSIYAKLPTDSEVERKFIRKLETRDDVKLYVKLPSGFKVRTPVGDYNPDWGIVLEERNQFGDPEETLYLVRETKGSLNRADLYQSEAQKIDCGRAHFEGALGVDFAVLTTADDLKPKKASGAAQATR